MGLDAPPAVVRGREWFLTTFGNLPEARSAICQLLNLNSNSGNNNPVAHITDAISGRPPNLAKGQ